jgi:tetratricopeptide (TPR) repeat protein
MQLYAEGYLEKAAEKMRQLVKTEEESRILSACYNNLGLIADDLSEFKRARAYFDEAVAVDPKNGHIWFNKGIVEYHDGDTKASLASFQKADKLLNGFDRALINIGNIQFELGNYESAYAAFKKIGRDSPLYRQSRYNIAITLQRIDPEKNAKTAAEILRSLLTRRDEIAFLSALHLGNIHFRKGETSQAREYYETSIALNTNSFIPHYNLALLEKQEKNYDKAIEHFQKALRNRKDFNPALRSLGELYYIKSDREKGLMALEEYALSTNDTTIQAALADLYYESGPDYYAAAFDNYLPIIQNGSGSEKKVALMNAGNIFLYYTNIPRAIEYYQQAMRIDPEDDGIFYNLGTAYALMNSFEEALVNFQKALTLNPKNDKAAMGLVLLYDKLNRPEKAIALCRNMMLLSQQGDLFRYLLASLLIKAEKTDDAERILQEIRQERSAYRAGVAFLRGYILDQKGEHDKAIMEYEKALAAEKNNLISLYNMGIAQYKAGKLEDAFSTFNKVFLLADSPKFMGLASLQMGNIRFREKEYAAAIEYMERALEHIPDSNAVHFNLQLARKMLKESTR